MVSIRIVVVTHCAKKKDGINKKLSYTTLLVSFWARIRVNILGMNMVDTMTALLRS